MSELWHISNACNMRCPFCYEEGDPASGSVLDEPAELSFAAGSREQIAGESRQVGLPRLHPVDGTAHGGLTARGHAEMEVGEVRDAQAVELPWEALKRHVDLFEPDPSRLEPRVAGSGCCSSG